MSDSMRRPTSKLSFITIMLTKLRSVPAPAPIAAPMKSIASFSSVADWSSVPCVSSEAVRSARPSLSFGSSAPPARTIIRMLTTGCSWWSTTTTCRPLGSVRIWYGGKRTSRAASGRGGPSDGQDAFWAAAGRTAARTASASAATPRVIADRRTA